MALLPPDQPDEFVGALPEFTSRRRAEALPPLRPASQRSAPASNALDTSWDRGLACAGWMAGFRWGVVATVGGLCLVVALIRGMQ